MLCVLHTNDSIGQTASAASSLFSCTCKRLSQQNRKAVFFASKFISLLQNHLSIFATVCECLLLQIGASICKRALCRETDIRSSSSPAVNSDSRCAVLGSPKLQALHVYDILPLENGAEKRCSECGGHPGFVRKGYAVFVAFNYTIAKLPQTVRQVDCSTAVRRHLKIHMFFLKHLLAVHRVAFLHLNYDDFLSLCSFLFKTTPSMH